MDDARITDLALRARAGDRHAAGEFVALTQHQIWRLLVHLASPAVAEELAQETYERAFGALRRYRAEAPARSWLLAIARHVAADHQRRRARRPVTAAPIDDGDRPLYAPTGSRDPAETVALREAVRALHPDRREAFVLTQLVGLSYEQAAHVCDCPVGTIRSRVARARADLVEAVGERSPGDAGQAPSAGSDSPASTASAAPATSTAASSPAASSSAATGAAGSAAPTGPAAPPGTDRLG